MTIIVVADAQARCYAAKHTRKYANTKACAYERRSAATMMSTRIAIRVSARVHINTASATVRFVSIRSIGSPRRSTSAFSRLNEKAECNTNGHRDDCNELYLPETPGAACIVSSSLRLLVHIVWLTDLLAVNHHFTGYHYRRL